LDIDLLITCAILQKQIDHIDGKMENIVIPIEKMNQINEQNKKEQAGLFFILLLINFLDNFFFSIYRNTCTKTSSYKIDCK
jgi:hypothetical protein